MRKARIISLALAVCGTVMAIAPTRARAQLSVQRLDPLTAPVEGSPATAATTTSIEVTKTAFVDGAEVCGEIHIRNTGSSPVSVSGVVDFLEVHFPRKATIPPGLPAGSTREWYKVADVPILLSGSIIEPGATATTDYCFSLCLAADSPGANSMRNVVTVTVTNESGATKTVTTRSVSFPPPVLDCQACCLPDGSCMDTLPGNRLPGNCLTVGGLPQGSGTTCTTTECPQACCHSDGSCTDEGPSACQAGAGEPAGPGTNCASTQCCVVLGASGCSANFECCPFESEGVPCNAGRCCVPPLGPLGVVGCPDDAACCAGTCHLFNDVGGKCCFELGASGCSADTECCNSLEGATCNAGTCCFSTGTTGCTDSAQCCNTNAICGNSGACCIPQFRSGCTSDSDCCTGLFCSGGVCEGVSGP